MPFSAATCACICDEGFEECGGECVASCDPGQEFDENCDCVDSEPETCPPGLGDCDGDGTCETDLTKSSGNCGVCGNKCKPNEICRNSICELNRGQSKKGTRTTDAISAGGVTCEGGLTICGEICVDTNADPANCGGCGTRCRGNETCASGICVPQNGGSPDRAPVEEVPIEKEPVEEVPVEEAPVEERGPDENQSRNEDERGEDQPVEEEPIEEAPPEERVPDENESRNEEAPREEAPVEEVPREEEAVVEEPVEEPAPDEKKPKKK